MARFRLWLSSCALLMMIVPVARSQSLPLSDAFLEKLSRPAGIVFSGTVIRIERDRDENSKPASMRIAFRVNDAVRGCYAGETIEIAEWAELWARGDRYRVGQNLFLFLYPRNAAGLTSPVAGDLGVFMFASQGLLRLTPQQSTLLSSQLGGRPTPGESFQAPTRLRSLTPKDLIRRLRVEAQ
ncbi:MAG TPA: hypothetical protein VMU28_03475 [Terriglobales bacterium]|nr:hypothetical protein [Terriglobales bacterium]